MPKPLPVLCIAGPTASGKSALAMALTERLPAEIISVDSAQVYRGMDIGTAKPTPAERAAVPHHLLDIRDPLHPYSAADFARDARQLIADIHARGRLPLLVGGTMLYFKALLQGLDDLPPADPAVRARLKQQAAEQGLHTLHAELAQIDPVTAARLPPGDSQRIQRALEVWHLTGQALSSFHASSKADSPNSWAHGAAVFVSLEPDSRAWLHERISQRFDAMLAAGLLDELRALRQRGDLSPELPALRAVGYRQAWQALDENWSTDMLRQRGSAATRQLAKRQLTWLRGLPERQRITVDQPQAIQQALGPLSRAGQELLSST